MAIEILNCTQGSVEWFAARCGRPTASEFKSVLAKGEGKVRRKYMMQLLAERMTGKVAEGFSNKHTDRGHEQEPEARNAYAVVTDANPIPVGFIRNGNIGCSPDALIGDDGLLEIKSKLPAIQCEVLLADKCPTEHYAQVQGQLLVTEREWCDFVSYSPGLPLFIKRVKRDELYIAALKTEIEKFLEELDTLQRQLQARYAA